MAPQAPEVPESSFDNLAPKTLPEAKADDAFHGTALKLNTQGHEERTFDINFKGMFNDLKNVDWSQVVWSKLSIVAVLHVCMLYGAWLLFSGQTMLNTMIWAYVCYFFSGVGITLGVHRLWAHRCYKAKTPLRIFLMLCHALSFQGSIYDWVRDHRVHHKFSETDADPYNAHRGLFFSHVGWVMVKKHPSIKEKGKGIDVSDITSDPVAIFQYKYYYQLVAIFCFGIPTVIPWYFWGEDAITALMVAGFLRHGLALHATWSINSIAHWFGSKPVDKNIYPVNTNFVNVVAMGEGWHNFHHVFPYDYRSSELGGWMNHISTFNVCTLLIDCLALIGQAYDRRTVSNDMIQRRILRTGDGSHESKKVK
ncbi:unnamed protein product, partial [Meganyctiphanes norvegica]